MPSPTAIGSKKRAEQAATTGCKCSCRVFFVIIVRTHTGVAASMDSARRRVALESERSTASAWIRASAPTTNASSVGAHAVRLWDAE